LPEFKRKVLEDLRTPVEDGQTIAQSGYSVAFLPPSCSSQR
jgi:predicted ATPase with chaperone activity